MLTTRVLTLVTLYQLGATLVVGVLTAWLWSAGALAVFVGGAFATVNFWGLRVLVERTLKAAGKHKIVYALMLAFKLALALGVMAGLLIVLRLHPLAFALGLAASSVAGLGLGITHVFVTQKAPTA